MLFISSFLSFCFFFVPFYIDKDRRIREVFLVRLCKTRGSFKIFFQRDAHTKWNPIRNALFACETGVQQGYASNRLDLSGRHDSEHSFASQTAASAHNVFRARVWEREKEREILWHPLWTVTSCDFKWYIYHRRIKISWANILTSFHFQMGLSI